MRLRFTIRDLLLVTALTAMGLGWWLDHRALLKRDDPVVEAIAEPLSADPKMFEARQKDWHDEIKEIKNIPFRTMVGSAMESFSRVQSDYPLHMVSKRRDDWDFSRSLTVKIMNGKKELLSIDGHQKSVFAVDRDVLYFVHYNPTSEGGAVTAHDFKNGKQLWRTELKAAGVCSHFRYENEIFMVLTPDEIELAGHETCGSYVEVLDRETGKMLANKQFRNEPFPKREDYRQE
jgi:hypothetical protein